MNRLSENIEEYDSGIGKIITNFNKKEDKVLLWDFDSVFYHCLYSGKDENGIKNPEYTEDDLGFLQGKLSEMYFKHLNEIEKYFNIITTYVSVAGKDNFRKDLYPLYKSNRPEKSPLIYKLYEYAKTIHNVIPSDGYEAEDWCYTLGKKLGNNAIIAFCDHDLEETPNCIMYNYQKMKWLQFTEKEAIFNRYKKIVIGEQGDFANFTPRIGLAYFQKNFSVNMTEKEYEEALFLTFVKAWRDGYYIKNKKMYTENIPKALEMLELAKKIIWLKEIN